MTPGAMTIATHPPTLVQVYDGATGQPLAGPLGNLDPFPGFHGGLYVAAGDATGAGLADVIVGQDGSLLAQFQPFGRSFSGGVRVAAADVANIGHADVVAGQGSGGAAVSVFDGASLNPGNAAPAPAFSILQPFGPSYDDGVYVGTGNIFGDHIPKILVGQGTGHDPQVGVFDGTAAGNELKTFLVRAFRDGARVAAADINDDGRADIVSGAARRAADFTFRGRAFMER
jgi:hypothetical protein